MRSKLPLVNSMDKRPDMGELIRDLSSMGFPIQCLRTTDF